MRPQLYPSQPVSLEHLRTLPDQCWPLLASEKLDGIRCLVPITEDECIPLSRTWKPIPNLHIRVTLLRIFDQLRQEHPELGNFVFDGELMLSNPRAGFNEIQSAVMSRTGSPEFVYHIFDLVHRDVLEEPFYLRQRRLNKFATLQEQHPQIRIVKQIRLRSPEEFETATIGIDFDEVEGLILRSPNAPYKPGRITFNSADGFKFVEWQRDEALLVAVQPKQQNDNPSEPDEFGLLKKSKRIQGLTSLPMAGSLMVSHPTFGTFSIGSGLSEGQAYRIWESRQKLIGAQVRFKFKPFGGLEGGKPRHPIFLGLDNNH